MIKLTTLIVLLTVQVYAEEIQTSSTKTKTDMQQEDLHPYVGLLTGAAVSKNADRTTGEFGIEAGYQMRPINLGAEFSGSKYENDEGQLKDKTNLLIKGQYLLSGDSVFANIIFLGIGIGVIVRSNNTDITAGPLAGFDLPIIATKNRQMLSVGAAAKYLFTNATPTEGVALNGSLKYWF